MKNLPILFITLCLLFACQPSSSKSENTNSVEQETAQTSESSTARPAYENIDVSTFQKKMKEDKVVILDVRTPGETKMGIIEGALEIDIQQSNFKEQIEKLDKNKTYLVYCKAGSRSSSACEMMAEAGFQNLYNLEGGYMAWPNK